MSVETWHVLDCELNWCDIKWWSKMNYLMMCNEELFNDV